MSDRIFPERGIMYEDIEQNLKNIFAELSDGNDRGEKITLVAATKFVPFDRINAAINFGLTHIGENKAQEFRDKFSFYAPCVKHFIGRIQENKLKYIVGKADVIDSVDSLKLAESISERAKALGITQDIMLEVNVGNDENKGGFSSDEIFQAVERIYSLPSLRLKGLMSMLPKTDDDRLIAGLTEEMRSIYDKLKSNNRDIEFLSVGTSGDYNIAIKHGSNAVRLGTAIFGERDYGVK